MFTEMKHNPVVDHQETSPNILIVEESDINRHLAEHVFIQAGFETTAVANGHDALHSVKQTLFDLILMDCRLSDFPQFMATRMIRLQEGQHHPGRRVPIIGLTAFAPPGFYDLCLKAGMDACFEKPFSDAIMQQITNRWLTGWVRPCTVRSNPMTALKASGDRPPHPGTSRLELFGRGQA